MHVVKSNLARSDISPAWEYAHSLRQSFSYRRIHLGWDSCCKLVSLSRRVFPFSLSLFLLSLLHLSDWLSRHLWLRFTRKVTTEEGKNEERPRRFTLIQSSIESRDRCYCWTNPRSTVSVDCVRIHRLNCSSSIVFLVMMTKCGQIHCWTNPYFCICAASSLHVSLFSCFSNFGFFCYEYARKS